MTDRMTAAKQVGIRFADGHIIRGDTWQDVETYWSQDFMNSIIEPGKFRDEIEQRAKLWSGINIATDGSAKDFMYECERAGLLSMIYDATNSSEFDRTDGDTSKALPIARLVYLARVREQAKKREERKRERAASSLSAKG